MSHQKNDIAQQLENAIGQRLVGDHPTVRAAIDHIRTLEDKLAKKAKKTEKKKKAPETRTPPVPTKVETVAEAKAKKGFFNRGK